MATIVRIFRLLLPALVALPFFAPLSAAQADAGRRVVLVIGNGGYQNAPKLANPPSDARALGDALRGLGFEVIEAEDLDQPDMLARLDEFSGKLAGADTGLFFYAGHGLQVAGENYLVPVDARLQREAQVPLQTMPLQSVLAKMEAAVPTRIVILDACRDNPIARGLQRGLAPGTGGVGAGLAEVRAAAGTLIAYATGPGDVAADGDGPHSPFTAALLDHIATPGLELSAVLRRVRDEVLKATGDRQVPWESSSLRGEFYFKVPLPAPEIPRPVEVQPTPDMTPEDRTIVPDGFDVRQADLSFWNAIASSRKPADFDAYLQKFPNGIFAGLARSRLEDLRATVPPTKNSKKSAPAEHPPAPAVELAVESNEAKPTQKPEVAAALEQEIVEPPAARIESALGLSREDWREVQRGLSALGFDTRGVDGKPGTNTRRAVASWQRSHDTKASGFLSPSQWALIREEAQPKLAALKQNDRLPEDDETINRIRAASQSVAIHNKETSLRSIKIRNIGNVNMRAFVTNEAGELIVSSPPTISIMPYYSDIVKIPRILEQCRVNIVVYFSSGDKKTFPLEVCTAYLPDVYVGTAL